MNYDKVNTTVEAKRFPDNGPSQHLIAEWIRSSGKECHLYDGDCVSDVKTSTAANWRWNRIHLAKGSAGIGDWIVKDGDYFNAYSDVDFRARFNKIVVLSKDL